MKRKKFSWWPEELALLTPLEDMTVSQVADKYRILGRGSSKPGRWETSFVPYMEKIMDSFCQDCVEEVWFQKCSQTGATEGLLNMILYAVIQDPGSAMLIEPTENLADEVSQERLDLMIQTTPQLAELKSANDDDLTKKKKVFQGMTVYLAWSNSPTSLASRPIRYCFFDEVDKYRKFSGEEANPLSLGKERTNTYVFNRKLVYCSTPTLDTGYIVTGEGGCDARFRYHIACPHCGELQTLTFEQVKFDKDHSLDKIEQTAWYECCSESCGGKIYNDQKSELVRRGKWIDIISGLPFDECMNTIRPKRIGFQVSRLYSPWHSFGAVAAEFLRSKDSPERLMNWRNSWMAEPWIDRLENKSERETLMNIVDIEENYVPKDYIALTCGIDPSEDGFWTVVLAWKRDQTCHLVGYDCLQSWDQIRQLVFETSVPYEDSENHLSIWRCLIDSGGGIRSDEDVTMTEAAYDWIRKNGRNAIFAAKGMSRPMAQKVFIKPVDRTPTGDRPAKGQGITLIFVDTSRFKDAIHYRLQIPPGDPGRFTFHKDTAGDYVSHLMAEERRRNSKTGLTQWVKIRKANHYLDATVLAFAAADPEFAGGVRTKRAPLIGEAEPPAIQSSSNWALGYKF